MYYEYWGLKKPPFDNVPDPSMYVSSHTSVENAIAETLYAIEEGNECLAVVVGDVGLGKTLSLRMVIDSLDQERYNIAFITNPDISFVQLLKEIIGQLSGQQCEQKRKIDLLEIFNTILFETADRGKKVLILIDEANAMSAANLESLRLLTNMQDDSRNLFTIVLAGQLELARRLEHPNRANLFQRIGTYCRLDKIESEEMVQTYVTTRMKLAGATRPIFTDDAVKHLWIHSEHGVPRLVNKICKLCLKAGETNGFDVIDGTTVELVADRFQRLTGPAIERRKPRVRESIEPLADLVTDEKPSATTEAGTSPLPPLSARASENQPPPPEDIFYNPLEEPAGPETPTAEPPAAVTAETTSLSAPLLSALTSVPLHEPDHHDPLHEPEPMPSATVQSGSDPSFGNGNENRDGTPEAQPQGASEEERVFGNQKVQISIPAQIVEQARFYSGEQRMKAAGVLAAQTLQKYPQLTAAFGTDPVALWSQIRDVILGKLAQEERSVQR